MVWTCHLAKIVLGEMQSLHSSKHATYELQAWIYLYFQYFYLALSICAYFVNQEWPLPVTSLCLVWGFHCSEYTYVDTLHFKMHILILIPPHFSILYSGNECSIHPTIKMCVNLFPILSSLHLCPPLYSLLNLSTRIRYKHGQFSQAWMCV